MVISLFFKMQSVRNSSRYIVVEILLRYYWLLAYFALNWVIEIRIAVIARGYFDITEVCNCQSEILGPAQPL